MSVQDMIKKSVLESGMFSQYDIPKILAALAVALILGSVIYLVYQKFYVGVIFSRSFAVTLVGMTVLTCMVTLAISSNIVISLGMFVVTLSILKMPYALLIGTLIAFTALIPIFGAFIGCAVGCFLIFMVNPKQAILFIIVFLILQQIEGNLIYPHVVGGSVGLPSIWVLAAVTIGGNLMGIVGMLIFIPLVSVLYTIFREFVYLRLKEKNIKQVTKTVVEEYTAEEIAAMEKNIKKNRE